MRSIINNICVNDQDQLIDIIDKLENGFRRDKSQASGSEHYAVNGELLDFLTSVEKAELDFLDMVLSSIVSSITMISFSTKIAQGFDVQEKRRGQYH